MNARCLLRTAAPECQNACIVLLYGFQLRGDPSPAILRTTLNPKEPYRSNYGSRNFAPLFQGVIRANHLPLISSHVLQCTKWAINVNGLGKAPHINTKMTLGINPPGLRVLTPAAIQYSPLAPSSETSFTKVVGSFEYFLLRLSYHFLRRADQVRR